MSPSAALILLVATASDARSVGSQSPVKSTNARRLVFQANGTIAEPGGRPLLLRGFTFYYTLKSPTQSNVTDEDRQVHSILPGTNFARLVMVHWHDQPTLKHGDCASDDAATGFLTNACLDQFDRIVAWASENMWVTITLRGSLAAGDGGDGATVWTNATLRQQMVSMWGFLARRYASRDHIAGYEVMSEPRVDDAAAIHGFHVDACAAVWDADPGAGCFVGPGKFYDRTKLDAAYVLADPRVVYAANMFDYVEGTNGTTTRAALVRKLGMISNFSTTFSKPVWIDQWGVQGDDAGGDAAHATYLRQILQLFAETRFHWSYWIWRRPSAWACPGGYAVECQYANGTYALQPTKVDALARWLGPSPTPLPPYTPIVPCPPTPEPLAACEAHARTMCASAVPQGYTACHKCVWGHRDDLVEEGCDFDGEHSAIVEYVCGSPPEAATRRSSLRVAQECVVVEREIEHGPRETRVDVAD